MVLVIALVVSLFVGVLGAAAEADDTSGTPSADTTSSAGSSSDPSPEPSASTTDDGLAKQLATTLGVAPTAVPESWVVRRGYSTSVNVAANDDCKSPPCTYTVGHYVPSTWGVRVGTTGVVTFKPPATTKPGRYSVYYRMTDANNPHQTAEGYVSVAVTADSYVPSNRVLFTHPYRKGYRYKIRTRILRTINSVPSGARIQVASWSFSSKAYYKALNQARKRGVIVQIVLSMRNKRDNSDYRTLRTLFGTTVTPWGSWVKKCSYSCRGRKGTMHSKIYLFSNSYRTPYVIMTGSANLTDFAVTNQWNQMNTVTGNKAVYDEGVRVFNQMMLDRPANPMYVSTVFPKLTSYYFPTTAATPNNDFMYKALNRVQCRGATNTGNGRTVVKIAMYAWYQERGKWLAKRVRQLWEQGCNVQIVYAISSNPVKKVLYSPDGRGRIPMRQILLTNTKGTPIYYLHDKWVAIRGHYGTSTSAALAFQGSFNFSDLGFSSDENFQMLPGNAYYSQFARDFDLLWRDKQARAPSPVSTITNIERTAPASPTLGTGTYRYMEAD